MKVDTASMLNQLNIASKADMLSKLSIGDTVRVQVLDVSSKSLVLRLPDGTMINASSLLELDVNLGDFLDLKVNHKVDGQIFVEVATQTGTESATMDELKIKLMSMNIPLNEKNMEMAQQMVKNNIAFTKENFQLIANLMKQHGQASPDKISFMLGNDIVVNQKNITLLDNFVQHKHQLGQQLKVLIEQLNTLKNDVMVTNAAYRGNTGGNTANAVNNALENSVSESHNMAANTQTQQALPSEYGQAGRMLGEELSKSQGSFSDSQGQTTPMSVEESTVAGKMNVKLEQAQSLFKELIQNKEGDLLEDKQFRGELMRTFADSKQHRLEDVLKSLFKIVDRAAGDKLAREINAEKLVKELSDALNTIKTEIEGLSTNEKNAVFNTIHHIQDNLNFLDQLNRFTTFVQIPVNINGQETTAELYIFKDNRNKKKIDPSNATVLVSLFTANLGQVEAVVNIFNKNVETVFRSEEQGILEFIRKNSTPLYNLLDAQGYRLTKVSYKQISPEQQANILNVQDVKAETNKRYTFDMRV